MLTLDKNQVRQILITREGMDPFAADLQLRNCPPIYDQLAGTVQQWLKDGTIQDVEVEGFSIVGLMKSRGIQFLEAVRALNRFLDPQLTPEHRQEMIGYLKHPVIRW